jgi:hypothetical protein
LKTKHKILLKLKTNGHVSFKKIPCPYYILSNFISPLKFLRDTFIYNFRKKEQSSFKLDFTFLNESRKVKPVRLRSLKLIIAKSWSIVEAKAVINDVFPHPVF